MAKMTIKSSKGLSDMLNKLGNDTERIASKAVREAANPLADGIRKRLEGNLMFSDETTGDLERSFGISPTKVNRDGNVDVRIGFSGYDSKGVANELKARVMESGSSKHKKRPFFRPEVALQRKKVRQIIAQVISDEISKITKE